VDVDPSGTSFCRWFWKLKEPAAPLPRKELNRRAALFAGCQGTSYALSNSRQSLEAMQDDPYRQPGLKLKAGGLIKQTAGRAILEFHWGALLRRQACALQAPRSWIPPLVQARLRSAAPGRSGSLDADAKQMFL